MGRLKFSLIKFRLFCLCKIQYWINLNIHYVTYSSTDTIVEDCITINHLLHFFFAFFNLLPLSVAAYIGNKMFQILFQKCKWNCLPPIVYSKWMWLFLICLFKIFKKKKMNMLHNQFNLKSLFIDT